MSFTMPVTLNLPIKAMQGCQLQMCILDNAFDLLVIYGKNTNVTMLLRELSVNTVIGLPECNGNTRVIRLKHLDTFYFLYT